MNPELENHIHHICAAIVENRSNAERRALTHALACMYLITERDNHNHAMQFAELVDRLLSDENFFQLMNSYYATR